MDHILVMPMHNLKGTLFQHLEKITPYLKEVFQGAVISVLPDEPSPLLADAFFRPVTIPASLLVGSHFQALYRHAAQTCPPEAVLHLCFPDRLAFQVETSFRDAFFASIRRVQPGSLPMLFQRSASAWATHPSNYREIEAAIASVGRWVCGRSLDFAWCHLAVQAGRLAEILPAVQRTDMSMMAEIIVQLSQDIKTEDVDWLAWEDPFILDRDASCLKSEREGSLEETRKRLSYALPMMDVLYQFAASQSI